MRRLFTLLLISFLGSVFSCKDGTPAPAAPEGLEALPVDTGGTHTAMPLGTDASPYGYYIYKPSAYTPSGAKYPLVIFLHGSGESGNSQTKAATLDKILVHGPPKLITQGKWKPKYAMMVASAQCHEGWWDVPKVHEFIDFIRTHYQVDTTRIYLTGLSMGGYGTWDQMIIYGKDSYLAASVPISGSEAMSDARTQQASVHPIWAFHGENDTTVPVDYDKAMNLAINALHPKVKAKLTLYPNTGHDCWTETYDGTGMGKEDAGYDPFTMDVFTWMLQYQRK